MFTLLTATEPPTERLRGAAFSTAAHAILVLLVLGEPWVMALLATLSALWRPQPLPTPDHVIMLVPPPGRPKSNDTTEPGLLGRGGEQDAGASVRIDDATELTWEPDESRQLIPVLRAHNGLIVFSPILDRTHPTAAFRVDGLRVAPPATLNHWIRLRMSNPNWWPEIDRLRVLADPARAMEVMAIFPPAYRIDLSNATQEYIVKTGLKSSRTIGSLRVMLDASTTAGVEVVNVSLASVPRARVGEGPRASTR